mmetsp:Transcript_18724/g.32188  ORF Transcript_18724/g.32188 Transcript_18724/m.32188 type:complete len:146 (+) Transcript_18724:166-603(+)|eukprot:CAMPEP_0183702760 /NCGR_PEP_ID=MMETSP0737-20130205/765_1 /TAXON_ID=385413 /ORGANISM="Thalassiosira miniscula, Strain CCMP1093" /LENGTH=145 /DNA_ID=CAMNT_0025929431 /DNA_START=94 /DNA_END=531 /DNA_ORIENTATION=-
MASDEEEGVKGNKKGMKVGIDWHLIKGISLGVMVLVFFFTVVLMMDAYKYISIRHAKAVRKTIIGSLQYMEPTIIEAHTGMKVLTIEEYDKVHDDLEKARKESREMNTKVQEVFSKILQKHMEMEGINKEVEELRKLVDTKDKKG